jgi:prepilin-type N-terminal cleavage/methylation domain-containing protein
MFSSTAAKNYKKGFTLIELMVVISIIGLLSSVVLASLNQTRIKARNSYTVSTINEYVRAFASYYIDNGTYPFKINDLGKNFCLGINISNCFWNGSGYDGGQDATFNSKMQPYYQGLPDPSPFPTDSINISGAIYSCVRFENSICPEGSIKWVKYKSEPCIVLNAINNQDYCQLTISF